MNSDLLTQKWDGFILGDDDSFAWLYKNHTQFLYEYGMRFTSDSNLVKDCIHDLFINIYKKRKSIPKPQNIKVYLLVSFKNTLLNVLNYSFRFNDMNENHYDFSFSISAEDEYIKNESTRVNREKVEAILSILSPRQKEVIYYRYLQELTVKDICLLMGLNYQSVQNLIQKALYKIRLHYGIDSALLLFLLFCR